EPLAGRPSAASPRAARVVPPMTKGTPPWRPARAKAAPRRCQLAEEGGEEAGAERVPPFALDDDFGGEGQHESLSAARSYMTVNIVLVEHSGPTMKTLMV